MESSDWSTPVGEFPFDRSYCFECIGQIGVRYIHEVIMSRMKEMHFPCQEEFLLMPTTNDWS
jgi:hypothetical protein